MSDDSFIPLSIPDLRGREREYLVACVDDNWVSSAGPFVIQLEDWMARLAERKYAVATVNGTTALQLALAGLELGADNLVVVPDWTFAASINAVYHAICLVVLERRGAAAAKAIQLQTVDIRRRKQDGLTQVTCIGFAQRR